MKKNNFKLIFSICLFMASFFLFVPSLSAAVLHWSPVESTQDCVISGYKIHYGISSGQYTQVVDVGNNTSYDLDLLPLIPSQTYYLAVGAYSTTNQEGPLSAPVSYTDSPHIIGNPDVNHTNETIDITFNESNMLGPDNKANYDFSPTIVFAAGAIVRTDRTYRLFMQYIPEYTIITMTLDNITDNAGNPLLSNSIVLNDDDNDSMADDWESHYGISTAFLDPDSDGLDNIQEYTAGTSPVDDDSDNDGMDDGWEIANNLNPLLDDASGDMDGDGISNLDEYNGGTGVSNSGPSKPSLQLPYNASSNIPLTPEFMTNPYNDPENDTHFKTQWQISTDTTFTTPENIMFELETYDSLTRLTIPEFILDPDKTYFWRVRFVDVLNGRSVWSDPFSFTTLIVNPEDKNKDGVSDIQQVIDGTIDLDDDGYMDVSSATYKMVFNGNISIGLEASDNVASVDFLKSIDPDDISDTYGKPSDLDFGLIQFKLRVDSVGATARVKIYFSEPVGKTWYKYDLINGWTEYSRDYPDNVQFSSDGKSVLLLLVDGGPGDSDGVANGIIVDPSGPGAVAGISSGSAGVSVSSDSGGGGGGCFIATAAFGSYMEKHVKILRDFRDEFLLKSKLGTAFVMAYYRYSPPIADVIARHTVLRAVVRVGLIPLIVFGYIVTHTTPFEQVMIVILMISLMAVSSIYISMRKIYIFPTG